MWVQHWRLLLRRQLGVVEEEVHSFTRTQEEKGIKQFDPAVISGLGSLIKISFDRSLILLPFARIKFSRFILLRRFVSFRFPLLKPTSDLNFINKKRLNVCMGGGVVVIMLFLRKLLKTKLFLQMFAVTF